VDVSTGRPDQAAKTLVARLTGLGRSDQRFEIGEHSAGVPELGVVGDHDGRPGRRARGKASPSSGRRVGDGHPLA